MNINEFFGKAKGIDERLKTISEQPEIIKVLQKHNKTSADIKDIYWTLCASGAGNIAQTIITSPELLARYLQMKTEGISDLEIAFTLSNILKGNSEDTNL